MSSGAGSFPLDAMEDAAWDGSRLRDVEAELVRTPDVGPGPDVTSDRAINGVGGAVRRGTAVRVLGSGALLCPSSSDTASAAMRVPGGGTALARRCSRRSRDVCGFRIETGLPRLLATLLVLMLDRFDANSSSVGEEASSARTGRELGGAGNDCGEGDLEPSASWTLRVGDVGGLCDGGGERGRREARGVVSICLSSASGGADTVIVGRPPLDLRGLMRDLRAGMPVGRVGIVL